MATQQTIGNAIELGTWLGRKQAFGLIAGRCSAADADCMRQLREDRRYLEFGMTWDEFCKNKLGMSRASADRVIHNLEEFGPKYFELAAVLRIPPEQYRQIAPAVTEGGIVCGGETIEISVENSSRLAQAIDALRGARPDPAPRNPRPAPPLARALRRARDSFHEGMQSYARALQLSNDPSDRSSILREMQGTRDALTRALQMN